MCMSGSVFGRVDDLKEQFYGYFLVLIYYFLV